MEKCVRKARIACLLITPLLLFACGGEEPEVMKTTNPAPDPIAGQAIGGEEISAESVEVADHVNEVADRYYANTLRHTPEIAYFAGVELQRHDGIQDNGTEARQARADDVDQMLRDLETVDVRELAGQTAWITHAYLLQSLRAEVGLRVCRQELWNVNQMGGWHTGYTQIAQLQPVGTPELRQQSLERWSKLPAFIDQEIANLERGLKAGYSAPRAVVKRVVDQLDGILGLEVEASPFFSPAKRDGDAKFAEQTLALASEEILPAYQRYRDYLAGPYMEQAREELSITANPGGAACYRASLVSYTTLDRSGKEVYELGRATVAANREHVIKLGYEAYGVDEFTEILERAVNDPEDRFSSAEELLQFSREAVLRAEAEMPRWIGTMPDLAVEVVPFEEHQEGKGMSAHYRSGDGERPGEYRIPLHEPEEQSRGNAEAVAFHEAWPGHHLQIAVAQSLEKLHPVTRIIWFAGPGEGWARYAEALAEEMGLYQTVTGPITRRAWPARGMVVDPGIHLFGWTREQAVEFMVVSGRFPESMGDQMVDRIAILPGQLTAYDSGALEIVALRREAERAMGEAFDIREFHDRVLEVGTIPLRQLRQHIEAWIDKSGYADNPAGDVRIRYLDPDTPELTYIDDIMRERQALEKLQAFLRPFKLPRPLTFTSRSCDGEPDAFYGDDEITICLEYMHLLWQSQPEQTTPSGVEPEDTVIGPFLDTSLHEFAHALFDMLDLPLFGQEENAADALGAYIYLQMGLDEARRLIRGTAYAYLIEATRPGAALTLRDYADDHGTPAQRAYNVLCMAYGADTEVFADFVDDGILPPERAEYCEEEYEQVQDAFDALIIPHFDQELAEETFGQAWLRPTAERR